MENVTRKELYLAMFPVWTFFVALTARTAFRGDGGDLLLFIVSLVVLAANTWSLAGCGKTHKDLLLSCNKKVIGLS